MKMHDTLCARVPRTWVLAATGDSAVNCFVFALDEVTAYKLKAECDIKNSHQTILVDFGCLVFRDPAFKQFWL